MILFDAKLEQGVGNDRFGAIYLGGQLGGDEIREFVRESGPGWVPLALARRDGDARTARGHVLAVSEGVLVVIDETVCQPAAAESEVRQQRIAELENLSAADHLTGAWSRAQFGQMAPVEADPGHEPGEQLTLVFFDIDRFERIGDDHGHSVGDAVLKEFIARIRGRLRAADSLFRWVDGEFVVLATTTGHRGGAVLAEGLRAIVAAEPFAAVVPVTVSLGVADYVEGEGAARWFRRTGESLHMAKSGGGNQVSVDCRGASDLDAERSERGVMRLNWLEAYECGEPTIDDEHRQLFALGNALLATGMKPGASVDSWRPAADALLAHVVSHFEHEEDILARHGYPKLDEHMREHASLVQQAQGLAAAVGGGESAASDFLNFLAQDLVARHLFSADQQFCPLFRPAGDGAGHRGVSAGPGREGEMR